MTKSKNVVDVVKSSKIDGVLEITKYDQDCLWYWNTLLITVPIDAEQPKPSGNNFIQTLKANKLVLGAISLLLVVLIIILVAVFAVPLFSNQLKCATDEFACKNGEKCIPHLLTCNGKLQDCSDGSDEECYDLVRTCYSWEVQTKTDQFIQYWDWAIQSKLRLRVSFEHEKYKLSLVHTYYKSKADMHMLQ